MTTTQKIELIELDDRSWIHRFTVPDKVCPEFETIWQMHPDKYGTVFLYGKEVSMPRWTQSYGRSFTFSGVEHHCKPIPVELEPFFTWACDGPYGPFDQLYINWYQDGLHYIGAHRDKECLGDVLTPILNLSLGQERIFRLRDYPTKRIVQDIPFYNKNILVMLGETNLRYTHEIPKITGKKGTEIGRRISITLRRLDV